MRHTLIVVVLALFALPLQARAAEDKFTGAWESRVAIDPGAYTMRLRCKSASDCELQMANPGPSKAGPKDSTLPFSAAAPFPGVEPIRKALGYALSHRADSAKYAEFAAIHRLLAASVDAKTEIDACIGLDDKAPEYFVVCSVRGATSWRPMLLLFGKLLGPCTHGFCGYVVYPLVKTGT